MLKGKCIQFLPMQHIKYLYACDFFSKSSLGQPLRIHSSSKASHLIYQALLSILDGRGERNISADLQISQAGNVLGEELMSMVSSVAIKFTIGPYQLVPTDAYRSHSEVMEEEKQERLDVL